jgi:hypothetical protein
MTHPAHYHLIELNFDHVHIQAHVEDRGDVESGPMIAYDPAYDEYTGGDEYLVIDENGIVHGPFQCSMGEYLDSYQPQHWEEYAQ